MDQKEKLNADAAGKAATRVMHENIPREMKGSIAYQNKDIVSKILAEHIKGKDLSILGLDLPRIIDIRPTNLPAVELNELRMDNLFLLEDMSYILVDYESEYSEKNKVKYMGYLARLSRGLYNESSRFSRIHLVIIYTADVKRGQTDPYLDMGAMTLKLTEVFLSDIDGEKVLKELEDKVERNEPLIYEDLVKLIVLPLAFEGIDAKKGAVSRSIRIADNMENAVMERYVVGLIMAFADKVITDSDRDWIRRMIAMSKFDRWVEEWVEERAEERAEERVKERIEEEIAKIEQEKARAEQEKARAEQEKVKAEQEKVKAEQEKVKAEQEKVKAEQEKVKAEQEKEEAAARTARNFLRKGISISDVAECTGLSVETVQRLAQAG